MIDLTSPRPPKLPDIGAASEFLRALAPDETEFTFQTFDDRKVNPRRNLARVLHGSLDEHWPTLCRLSSLGAGAFVTFNQTNLKARLAKNVIAARGLFVDLDGTPLDVLPRLGLRPHIIVQTSSGRFQIYWMVEGVGLNDFPDLQRRLAILLDGDSSVCDLPRVMRLPGFPHQKNPAQPHLVQALAYGRFARHKLANFTARLSAGEMKCPPASNLTTSFATGIGRPPDMKQGFPDGQRTVELTRRAGWCLGPGGNMSEPQAIAACLAWNQNNRPPLADEKVCKTVASIARKEAGKRLEIGQSLPIIEVEGGELSREADKAEQALIEAGFPIFVRAGALVSPVFDEVPASRGRTTTVARLRKLGVDSISDYLSRSADFRRFDERSKKWVRIDPPERVARIVLTREGAGKFPQVAGVTTTPTLRADGSVLADPGYDPSTRLYLALDEKLAMPSIPAAPSRADALKALESFRALLSGFPFVSRVDRAVALSGLMTAVLRGALSVAPMHVLRAHTAGTGKSLLVDVAAAIATGRPCPVIAAGKTEEETEKRLGALLCDGVAIVSIDNVNGELGGDALAQMTERPLVRVRPLGKSEAPEFECKAAIFATGNNLTLLGDMVRRAVIGTLDAGVERPELRDFEFDPIERVLQNRGAYVAACLTIALAYRAAGSPAVCRPVGSYGEWSETVRAPLIWLGEADPIDSMEAARQEDPELAAIRELFVLWGEHLGDLAAMTTSEIIKFACERSFPGSAFNRPEFRDLLLRVAGEGGAVSPKRLGKWLSKIAGRVVNELRLEMKTDRSHGNRFALRPAPEGGRAL
jgi:hypothetical protein